MHEVAQREGAPLDVEVVQQTGQETKSLLTYVCRLPLRDRPPYLGVEKEREEKIIDDDHGHARRLVVLVIVLSRSSHWG